MHRYNEPKNQRQRPKYQGQMCLAIRRTGKQKFGGKTPPPYHAAGQARLWYIQRENIINDIEEQS